ncbi:hypothetical protein EVB32_223 [Rhizobium phage RHph_TM39]|nr:hypothetical protein EVB32_223 [Rhizobium phage RHph_TM39]
MNLQVKECQSSLTIRRAIQTLVRRYENAQTYVMKKSDDKVGKELVVQ